MALGAERGMRPIIAHCRLGLGKLHRRIGKHEQAQAHLTTATTMYREMGMTCWLERAEAEMRAARRLRVSDSGWGIIRRCRRAASVRHRCRGGPFGGRRGRR